MFPNIDNELGLGAVSRALDSREQLIPSTERILEAVGICLKSNHSKCNLQYVGSTTTEFKVRFRNHKSSMKTNKKTCEGAIHFNLTPHVLSDFTFQCINQIKTSKSENTENLLITKEAYWSAQLLSLSALGLHKRQEFHSKNRIHYT